VNLSPHVIHLQANPDPGYTWLHPNGREIEHTRLEKYVMDIDQVSIDPHTLYTLRRCYIVHGLIAVW
jgi:hypothetical protein